MKKLLLVLLLGSCVSAFGQGARFGDANPTQTTAVVPGTSGLLVKVIPGATINFCSWPANAVPCTNKATTYTDYTLTTPCATSTQVVLSGTTNCVGTADPNGNWGVWVAPGLYQYTFTYQGNNYGPFFAIPTGNGVSTLNCPNAANVAPGTGAVGVMTSVTGFNCDPNFISDLAGNFSAQSGKFLGPVNGFFGVIGGTSDPGTQAKFKLGTNEVRMLAPLTVPTPYYWRIPGTRCTVGQGWQMTGETTDANGDKVDTYGCGSFSSITVQTNGVNNSSQALLNLQAGSNITITNTSGGNVQISASGAAAPQASNPTAPTLANQNGAGARSITIGIQGCEDGATCAYHSTLVTTTIANANASPQVLVSAYGDTLYGYRCYDVYVTADSGARTGVPGRIANCVGKKYIDTGGNGSGVAATNTNTTVLDANGLTNPLPGCNKIPAAPYGIDGPPCSPKALDDEMGATFGNAGDANSPFWAWQAQGSCTATWTSGMLSLACPSTGGTSLHCLLETAPATPYKFASLLYGNWIPTANGPEAGIGFFETATGKFETITMFSAQGVVVRHWTNATTAGNVVVGNNNSYSNNGFYFQLEADGTNLKLDTSPDGVIWTLANTEAKASFFTTAPDKVGICVNSFGIINAEYDWWRETQ